MMGHMALGLNAVPDTRNNCGIQSLDVTRDLFQTTDIAGFRVCYKYGDLHVRENVFEQVAERPWYVMLIVTKVALVNNVCTFHNLVTYL
jgi:hypothetical protein